MSLSSGDQYHARVFYAAPPSGHANIALYSVLPSVLWAFDFGHTSKSNNYSEPNCHFSVENGLETFVGE